MINALRNHLLKIRLKLVSVSDKVQLMIMNKCDAAVPDPCKRGLEDENSEEPNKKLCADNNVNNVETKIPKRRKYAIIMGYNGNNYHGMQINKEHKTIEYELLQALHKAGIVSESEALEPYLIKFQRAARTDKAVSAACQVVSCLMGSGYKAEDVNIHLPPSIKVYSIKRVTKGFNSKDNCEARTYSYLLPTVVLSQEPIADCKLSNYRITEELIQKVDEVLSLFHGTHCFHNFTSRRLFQDPSSKRYIMSFKCGVPFVNGKEFVALTVKGQSFMLHQIRKMVGTVIAIMRGVVTQDIIHQAFLQEKLSIPLAPGEGLFLEKPHFDKYNRRYGNDGFHELLDLNDIEEEVQKFRKENIITPITELEVLNQVIVNWVEKYLHGDYSYFTKEGNTGEGVDKAEMEAEMKAEM